MPESWSVDKQQPDNQLTCKTERVPQIIAIKSRFVDLKRAASESTSLPFNSFDCMANTVTSISVLINIFVTNESKALFKPKANNVSSQWWTTRTEIAKSRALLIDCR